MAINRYRNQFKPWQPKDVVCTDFAVMHTDPVKRADILKECIKRAKAMNIGIDLIRKLAGGECL